MTASKLCISKTPLKVRLINGNVLWPGGFAAKSSEICRKFGGDDSTYGIAVFEICVCQPVKCSEVCVVAYVVILCTLVNDCICKIDCDDTGD